MVHGCGVYTAIDVQCTYVLLATPIACVAAASCVLHDTVEASRLVKTVHCLTCSHGLNNSTALCAVSCASCTHVHYGLLDAGSGCSPGLLGAPSSLLPKQVHCACLLACCCCCCCYKQQLVSRLGQLASLVVGHDMAHAHLF